MLRWGFFTLLPLRACVTSLSSSPFRARVPLVGVSLHWGRHCAKCWRSPVLCSPQAGQEDRCRWTCSRCQCLAAAAAGSLAVHLSGSEWWDCPAERGSRQHLRTFCRSFCETLWVRWRKHCPLPKQGSKQGRLNGDQPEAVTTACKLPVQACEQPRWHARVVLLC